MEILFLLYKISLWGLTMLVVQLMFYCPLEVPQDQFLKHHPMTLKSVSDINMSWMMCLLNSEMRDMFWVYTIVENASMWKISSKYCIYHRISPHLFLLNSMLG